MQFPERHSNHSLEQKSETFFIQHIPKDWNVSKPQKDYGQDLNIEICEAGKYKGLDLIVQLKASKKADNNNGYEKIIFKTSTYNYLWNNLRVVLLVKFVESENEGYWILLKDVAPPNSPDQETFVIGINRNNKVTKIDWENQIVKYVRHVTDKKLVAQRMQDKTGK